ncbi:MAG: pyrroloquinoline quinone biosynthesis peptide chaperone PqqD [Gemmatimonadaceae bacterium]
MPLSADARPALWRLARLRYDEVRERPVLLYPEGALLLNATAAEILALCDGARTVAEIAAELGARYQTDVAQDVAECLSILAERELVRDVSATPATSEAPEARPRA